MNAVRFACLLAVLVAAVAASVSWVVADSAVRAVAGTVAVCAGLACVPLFVSAVITGRRT